MSNRRYKPRLLTPTGNALICIVLLLILLAMVAP